MTVIPLGGRAPRQPRRPGTARPRRSALLYEDVIALIGRLISEGGLGPGDKLPSQRELAELAQVSLITVRRALEELERDGRVRRHQGLGTFLTGPKILSDPSRTGRLGVTLGDAGEADRVGTKLLEIAQYLPSADVAAALGVDPADHVWRVRRVRTIADKPSIAELAMIPVHLAPDLDAVYRGGSLYETLRSSYGLDDDYEEQVLDVIAPTAEVRALLNLDPRALVVRIQGLSRDHAGVAFDCFEQVYPAADFAFAIAGQTERRLQRTGQARDWSATRLPAGSG
jgi:GntR family transcriptional regulator